MKTFNYPVGRSNGRRERGNDLSTQKEYGVDHFAVSGDASLRHLLCLQRFSAAAHIGLHRSSLFCLFLVFSTSILYAWSPRIDVPRNYSAFSANAPSWLPCIHPSRSFQVWFRTLLLGLTFYILHFSDCQCRKQSAEHGHCCTQKIDYLGLDEPKKGHDYKACYRKQHKFIDVINFHFFLRGLSRDFCVQPKFYSSPRRPPSIAF